MEKNKKPFAKTLINYRKRIYSQTIEDGIIEGIFKNIGTTNKYFVEFGAWDGTFLSNTGNLRINEGWNGLLMEGNKQKADQYDYVQHEFITAENINELFSKHNVPKEFDLLSVDLDGNDYWIWKALDETKFKARVVIVEFNCNMPNQLEPIAVKYSPELDTTDPSIYYYSATISAWKKLAESKGYSLIYRVNNHNLFFVDTSLLHEEDINIPIEMFLNKDNVTPVDRPAPHGYENKNVYGYDTKLLHDVFYGEEIQPHWNEYADVSLTKWWPQNLDKEWVTV
jgi:hypothetical protein